MPALDWWPRRPPHKDRGAVGISFVDVLFALVIAEILAPLRYFDAIPGYGLAHLAVAATLTLTSWVGYHNSHNRPQYLIRFPNKPLAQFVLDIAMVVAYWLAAVTAEVNIEGGAIPAPSAAAETWAVAASFGLYVVWDFVARQIRHDERYRARPASYDVPRRRGATMICAALVAVIAGVVYVTNPDTARAVYLVDAVLIVLLIGFRLLKEMWTPVDLFVETTCPECGQDLQAV